MTDSVVFRGRGGRVLVVLFGVFLLLALVGAPQSRAAKPVVGFKASSAAVSSGQAVRLAGVVKRGARGQRVVLLAKLTGARWAKAGVVRLPRTRRFAFRVRPPLGRTAFRAVVLRKGRTPGARSRAVRVLGRPAVSSAGTLSTGDRVKIGGWLPTRIRRKVVLQRRDGGGWRAVAARASTAKGFVAFGIAVSATTGYRLFAPAFRQRVAPRGKAKRPGRRRARRRAARSGLPTTLAKRGGGGRRAKRTRVIPAFTSPPVNVQVEPASDPAENGPDQPASDPNEDPPDSEPEPPVVLHAPSPAPGPSDPPASAPANSASDLSTASATSHRSATAFLYTGGDPIQKGVAPGAIETKRSAVLRGRVTNRSGGGIGGVRVTVADHPEYGRTATRVDGGYELAVNGGGSLTLVFEREGWIPAQRQVDVPWQDYAEVDPLVLVPYDERATRIDTGGSGIVAVQASTVDDGGGERTQTLLFSPGTIAEMRVGGTFQPIGDKFTVRSTEFTQGADGIDAMPGQLPRNTAYTYAAEFSLDEAVAAQATNVRFSRPVVTYLENFLGLPVGAAVPAGYYDREREQWVGAPNGRVVEVVPGGIDTDGDETADNSGISAAERDEVIDLYAPGTELWRVEVMHFTPWDYNYPYGPPDGTTEPPPTIGPRDKELLGGPDASIGPAEPPEDNPCPEEGSIIRCDDQVLGERLPVAGAPLALVYASDRVPGRRTQRTIEIVLRDGTLPASLEAVDLEIDVAGRTFAQSFTPAEVDANPVYEFIWDGLDAYGRRVYGSQVVETAIGYRYPAVYQAPTDFESSWAQVSGVPITGDRSRQDFTLWRRDTAALSFPDVRGAGFGGWTISAHHEYDPTTHTLRLGDGRISGATANRLAALEQIDTSPALDGPTALATAPDGATWIADTRNQLIRRVAGDGSVTTVAGTGDYGFRAGDGGGPATSARLSSPQALSVVDGGEGATVAYVADTNANRIRMIAADGTIATVAGGGSSLGDGGPATEARLSVPQGVVAAPDGALYVADTGQHRIRMIGTDGRIATIAGDGIASFEGDGGPAVDARLRGPTALALDADGRLLIADTGNGRVRRIGLDGKIATVIGGGDPGDDLGDGELATAAELREPAGLAVGRGGELIVADPGSGRVRMVDEAGSIRTIAGGGSEAYTEKTPAAAVDLNGPTGVTIGADQALVVSEPAADRVSHVQQLMPGFSDGDLLIPSEDGDQVFQFDAEGRHERTLDALTGAVVRRFAYDAAGRLTNVYDDAAGTAQPHSPVLTIARPDEDSVVLHTRGGRETELAIDGNGWLDSATNPAGEAHDLTHDAEGLLVGEEDAEGGTHSFEYDALGRLVKDTGPDGAFKTLTVAEVADGRRVTMETSGGQATIYRDTLDAEGNRVHRITDPSGGLTVSTRRPDGSTETTYADGSTQEVQLAPHPRFGMQAPYAKRMELSTPEGRTRTYTAQRSVVMRDASKLESSLDTVSVDGRETTKTFTANPGDDGGTLSITSAEGRESTTEFDDHGRIVSTRAADGMQTATVQYDDVNDGRITSEGIGDRTYAYSYDARNRIVSRTDSEGRETTYTYDDADRLLTSSLDGETWTQTFDDAGRRVSLQTPSGALIAFDFTPSGLADQLTLPGTAAYDRDYTGDEFLRDERLPSGAGTENSFDAHQRMSGSTDTRAAAGAAVVERGVFYDGDTVRPSAMTWTTGGPEQRIDWEHDGERIEEIAFSGPSAGTFTYVPEATGVEPASLEVAAGAGPPRTYDYSRDDDGLITAVGPLTIARDAATGRAEAFTYAADGTTVETLDTEGYGELDRRRVVHETDELYDLTVQRDDTGRVVGRTESIAGGADVVRVYRYDPQGRLTEVEDGSGGTVEEYAYDDDGNRTSATAPGHGAEAATYDATTGLQTSAGPLVLAFDEDGFLTDRGGDEYTYGPRGELLEAEAGSDTVTYAYDAIGRRVRRADDGGGETNYLYGNPHGTFDLTATTDAAGALTTYFYDEQGHLHAIERDGDRYRVGTDQVGTPRVVIDADGAIVKEIERDSYGRLVSDSAPGFELAIGFAGGIDDPSTGLVRFGLRDYDPETGRFTARDPSLLAGSPRNLFTYAGSSPAGLRDPTGLSGGGFYSYIGIGGGVSYSQAADGTWSICTEVGIGFGAGADVDPLAQPTEGEFVVSEIGGGAKAGPILSVDGSYGTETVLVDPTNPCPPKRLRGGGLEAVEDWGKRTTATVKGGLSAAGQGGKVKYNTKDGFSTEGASGVDLGVSVGGKVAKKNCYKMKGSFFW